MTDRSLYTPPELPESLARRDLRVDERFDVIETFEVRKAAPAFPVKPRIVSSAHGPISHLMLWYPAETKHSKPYRSIYTDLFEQLPPHTRVTMVVHPDSAADAEALASTRQSTVTIVTAPDWLAFTVWAEDACVVVEDVGVDPTVSYLVEPFGFPRGGDTVVVDLMAQATDLQATQLPLTFQGGNVLIGDTFILIGRDYLDDSITGAVEHRAMEGFPYEGSSSEQEAYISSLFRKTFDPDRDIYFLESDPIGRLGDRIVTIDGKTVLDEVSSGRGNRQPIFHIDMFVSLAGRDASSGKYRVLVGDPRMADEMLGWSPEEHSMYAEFDAVAEQLAALGFSVQRAPLPYLAAMSPRPGQVTGEDGKLVTIDEERLWYHATSNNCLVQIDEGHSDVWLPTYGGGTEALAVVDAKHKMIWEEMGFVVHQLGDFHAFASNFGALHCIKKYLAR